MPTERTTSQLENGYKSPLASGLHTLGIEIPQKPHQSDLPGQWIIRCEAGRTSPLVNREDQFLRPISGEWATNGVFFADCLSPLPSQSEGTFYVFGTFQLIPDFVATPSPEWNDKVKSVAAKNSFNLRTINGGYMAEEEIYKTEPVYRKNSGIITVPFAVDITSAKAILVSRSEFANLDRNLVPQAVADKIVLI